MNADRVPSRVDDGARQLGMRRLLAARWRVLLLTVGALLVLDAGRSLWARLGYARPRGMAAGRERLRRPDLAAGRGSPGRRSARATPLCSTVRRLPRAGWAGQRSRRPSLVPRPVDFVRGQFKYKSTPGDRPPTDVDLLRVVTDGLQASAMPYFGDLLTPAEIRAVVDYIKGLSLVFAHPAPAAIPVPPRVPPDAASVARGRDLYAAVGCGSCHGPDGRHRERQHDARGYPVITRDLTAPWTFAGGSEPVDVWRRLDPLVAQSHAVVR